MKIFTYCFLISFIGVAIAGADGVDVLIVAKDQGEASGSTASGAEIMASSMDLPQAVAAMFSPSVFTRKLFSKALAIQSAASISWSETGKLVVDSRGGYQVRAYRLKLSPPPALPKARKRSTVKFSLAELVKSANPYNPAYYALRAGMLKSGWLSGLAWVESLRYENGAFTAVVALAKGG